MAAASENQKAQQPGKPSRFFAKREKVYPRTVKGRYRTLKWVAMAVTLAIYYLAPLIRWDRGPNAPDQAILIDIPHRRAYWFLIEIWPQEVYYLTAILIFAAIALFFVTSLLGRVWCGYFCPQTVWTDLFYAVENWIQGDRNARMRLDKAPWTFTKVWKKFATHAVWLLIALSTAGAFVFYFNDAPTLWRQIFALDVSPAVLGFMAGLTGSTYLMAGFAREQVCTYMCPYARFQAAMFDKNTMIIGYDADRGELRGSHKKGESWEGRGHCIDCTACVQVCPVGIDIREGLQMECIACGLCVDACNDIMDKIDLPRGLIRYDTEQNVDNRRAGKPEETRVFRPRSLYYMALLTAIAGLVLYGQVTRKPFELHAMHSRNPLYVRLSDGQVSNGYEIKILNKTHNDATFALSLDGLPEYTIEMRGAGDLHPESLHVGADRVASFHVFIHALPQAQVSRNIRFTLTDTASGAVAAYDSMFISGEGK